MRPSHTTALLNNEKFTHQQSGANKHKKFDELNFLFRNWLKFQFQIRGGYDLDSFLLLFSYYF